MSRITNKIAEDVANLMVQSKQEEINLKKEELKEYVTRIYRKSLPKEILNIYEKYPEYMIHCSSVQLTGKGFNHEYVNIHSSPARKDYYTVINIKEEEDINKIRNLYDHIKESNKNIKVLKLDIENALKNLRTYKKVESEFPEAFKHLPNKVSAEVSICLKSIKDRL